MSLWLFRTVDEPFVPATAFLAPSFALRQRSLPSQRSGSCGGYGGRSTTRLICGRSRYCLRGAPCKGCGFLLDLSFFRINQVLKRTKFRPTMESLEQRSMFAADLTGGVLKIVGTSGADTIVVSQSGSNALVTFNSVNQMFPLANISSVLINGRAGSDTISFTLDKDVTIHGGDDNDTITTGGLVGGRTAAIYGGLGNDTITSSDASRVTILGNEGDDTITATTTRAGTIFIRGGIGDDTITANQANRATIHGEAGKDIIRAIDVGIALITGGDDNDSIRATARISVSINGEGGNDTITSATPGTATLKGGGGDDIILSRGRGQTIAYGGDGNDTLTGSSGLNRLFGGAGVDQINGRGTTNTLYGGTERDTFDQEGGPSRLFVDQLDVYFLRAGLDTAVFV